MDNQTHNSENDWVDRSLESIAPPGDWYPDSKRAFAQFQNRRGRPETEASPPWIRLTMAAAILASIGLVVTLLPWHALWNSSAESKSRLTAGPMKAETKVVVPEPATLPPAPKPPVRPQPPVPAAVAAIQQTAPPAPEPEQKPVEHAGPVVTPPRAIPPTPEPEYTDDARRAHIQGNVILDVIIHADGTVNVKSVFQGLGYGLDEKAIEAFEKWRFSPGTIDGKPVDVQLRVTMGFHLY